MNNEMPDPDEFAKNLDDLTGNMADAMRDIAYELAVADAKKVIDRAAEIRQHAVQKGFSSTEAGTIALDFWGVASGLRDE
ncbi:hypothetical protein GCM10020221_11550 [Streptomyces thioluteus]|uniref:Uncharacterized protein n=2 Tax=Streptomyces thioluteus TaxID=66431 RepID=A0ABP6J1K6_STRTU